MPMMGKSLTHYHITCQLRKSGMGDVYRVRDQKLSYAEVSGNNSELLP